MSRVSRLLRQILWFVRDNFMILAFILLVLWLLVIWIWFRRGVIELEDFTAYAMFGTALATALLAFATTLMAQEARAARKLNELYREREFVWNGLIKQVIDPLLRDLLGKGWAEGEAEPSRPGILGVLKDREVFSWDRDEMNLAKRKLPESTELELFQLSSQPPFHFFIPNQEYYLKALESLSSRFTKWHWQDFRLRHPSLAKRLEAFSQKKHNFEPEALSLAINIRLNLEKTPTPHPPAGQQAEQPITEEQRRMFLTYLCRCVFWNLVSTDKAFQYALEKAKYGPEDEMARGFYFKTRDSIISQLPPEAKGLASNIVASLTDLAQCAESIAQELKKLRWDYMNKFGLYEELR